MKSLEQYLRDNHAEKITEFRLRITMNSLGPIMYLYPKDTVQASKYIVTENAVEPIDWNPNENE